MTGGAGFTGYPFAASLKADTRLGRSSATSDQKTPRRASATIASANVTLRMRQPFAATSKNGRDVTIGTFDAMIIEVHLDRRTLIKKDQSVWGF